MCNFSIQKINKNYFIRFMFLSNKINSFLFPYRTFFNVHISCFHHFVFPRSLLSITKQGSRNSVATFDEYLNLLLEEWWIKYRVKRQSEGFILVKPLLCVCILKIEFKHFRPFDKLTIYD